LLPVAIAIVIGALTLFSGPTGIASVGALLVAVGPLKTIVARHTSRFGHLALLAPILAACTVTIPTDRTDRAQELHLCIGHAICERVEAEL